MRACASHGGDIHLAGVADPQRGRAGSSACVVRFAKNDVKHGSRAHWCKHGTVLLQSHAGRRDGFARPFSVAVGPRSRPLKRITAPSSLHLVSFFLSLVCFPPFVFLNLGCSSSEKNKFFKTGWSFLLFSFYVLLWFFGLLYHHTTSNSITTEMHTSGVQ